MARRGRRESPAVTGVLPWIRSVRRLFTGRPWFTGTACSALGIIAATCWIRFQPVSIPTPAPAPAASLHDIQVDFGNVPVWVDEDRLVELEALVVACTAPDPFPGDDLGIIRHALLDTGWFRDVHQVRRSAMNRITIEADFAVQYALVRFQATDYLVDTRGARLPRHYPAGSTTGMTVILGASAPPPACCGMAWSGSEVQSAIELMTLLRSRPWYEQVRMIDAGRYAESGSLDLLTDIGAIIHWGRPAGREEPLEISAADKIRFLDEASRVHGRIDCGHARTWQFLNQTYIASKVSAAN